MKPSAKYILYLAIKNYLSKKQLIAFDKELKDNNPLNGKKFLTIVNNHFNIDKFKDEPFFWQDIWLFNYIKYEMTSSGLVKKGLLKQYAKVMIKDLNYIEYCKINSVLGS